MVLYLGLLYLVFANKRSLYALSRMLYYRKCKDADFWVDVSVTDIACVWSLLLTTTLTMWVNANEVAMATAAVVVVAVVGAPPEQLL